MYSIKLKPLKANQEYRFVQMKNDEGNYINIYISLVDEYLWLTISNSTDGGFLFKDVTKNFSDLSIDEKQNFDTAIHHVKKYFKKKGYIVVN